MSHVSPEVTRKRQYIRRQLARKYGNECNECFSKENITLDHIVPLELGGKDEIGNCQLLCYSCNQKRAKIQQRNPLLLDEIQIIEDLQRLAEENPLETFWPPGNKP